MMNDSDLPIGVTRVEHPSFAGYVSRVYGDCRKRPRYFSIAQHGDWDKAREAAIADQRERNGALVPRDDPRPRFPFRRKLSRNNRTGVNGISLGTYRTLDGHRSTAYMVTWTDSDGRHTKRFPIDEYVSREAAMNEARQFRREWEREALAKYEREMKAWKRRRGM